MQSIPEIVETEKQRTNLFECRIAKLYRVGSFMRAYNWSAWLFVKYRGNLKVSNRRVKAVDESVAMVGFPPSSIENILLRVRRLQLILMVLLMLFFRLQ